MRVTIRLFARLRDIAGAPELEREIPAGSTLRGVWQALTREFGELERYSTTISGAVNEQYARMDALVEDGDEVAFLPPVSGGDVASRAGGAVAGAERIRAASRGAKATDV